MQCLQLRAGIGTTECTWAVSSQLREWVVFIWDDLGELVARLTASEPSLNFEMPVDTFDKHFTVQVGQRTAGFVLYGKSALFYFLQI